jgi:beta-N-acetylhexosaminidase
MVDEYRSQGILATVKHFPGHGSTDVDSHAALPVVSRTLQSLIATDVLPFTRARADAVMTAHVLYSRLDPDAPATLSPKILHGLLRERLSYDGLIVSDSLLMGALTGRAPLNEIAVRAFAAGVDVLAIGADTGYTRLDRRTTYQAVLDAVNADPALQRRLDESVRRILTVKARYGLLDHQPADPRQAAVVLGDLAHRATADRIARDSVTQVRDEDRLIPIRSEANVWLVLPAAANDLGSRLRACHRKLTVKRMRQNPTAGEAKSLARRAARFDVVVLATMNVNQHPGHASVAKALAAGATPLIVVALQSPYDLLSLPEVKTYLTAFGDVPASLQALADVLCGNAEARGKLPVKLAP